MFKKLTIAFGALYAIVWIFHHLVHAVCYYANEGYCDITPLYCGSYLSLHKAIKAEL